MCGLCAQLRACLAPLGRPYVWCAHYAQPALATHSCVQPGATLKAPFHLSPAEVLALDAARAERCVSCGADRTCRVWKIPEESQLIFRWGRVHV